MQSVRNHFHRLIGHNQVTGAYLLALAATTGAVLLMLDRRIVPPGNVRDYVEVLMSDRF